MQLRFYKISIKLFDRIFPDKKAIRRN